MPGPRARRRGQGHSWLRAKVTSESLTQRIRSDPSSTTRPFSGGSGAPGSHARPCHPVTRRQQPRPPRAPSSSLAQSEATKHPRGRSRGEKAGGGLGESRRGGAACRGQGVGGIRGSSEPFCVPQDLRQRGVAVIRPGGRKLAGLGGRGHTRGSERQQRGAVREWLFSRGREERRGLLRAAGRGPAWGLGVPPANRVGVGRGLGETGLAGPRLLAASQAGGPLPPGATW